MRSSQAFTLELALRVLETAPAARTTVQSPLAWSASPDWKLDFQNVAQMSPEEIARRRAEFDKQKEVAKTFARRWRAREREVGGGRPSGRGGELFNERGSERSIRSYKDLDVWQKSMALAEDCYRARRSFLGMRFTG